MENFILCGVSTFPVAAECFTKPLRWKRLCAHDLAKNTFGQFSSLLFLINPLAVEAAIELLIANPLPLATN